MQSQNSGRIQKVRPSRTGSPSCCRNVFGCRTTTPEFLSVKVDQFAGSPSWGCTPAGSFLRTVAETHHPKRLLVSTFAASGTDASADAQFIPNMSLKLCGMSFQKVSAAVFVGEYQLAGCSLKGSLRQGLTLANRSGRAQPRPIQREAPKRTTRLPATGNDIYRILCLRRRLAGTSYPNTVLFFQINPLRLGAEVATPIKDVDQRCCLRHVEVDLAENR